MNEFEYSQSLLRRRAELVPEYKKLLIEYYEDSNDNIKAFLKDKCYTKIEFNK